MTDKKKISRVTRSKTKAHSFYDRFSRQYDFWSEGFEGKFRRDAFSKLNAREGELLLEIGYGTGHGLLSLAEAVGNSGRVYGIDIAEGMRGVSIERLQESDLDDRVELKCGDAADLPYKDGFFDGILISFTLELFDTPELPLVLGECRRVLKPRGRIVIASMSKARITPMVRLYEGFHRLLPQQVDCRPLYLRDLLKENGFQIQLAEIKMSLGLPVEIVLGIKW